MSWNAQDSRVFDRDSDEDGPDIPESSQTRPRLLAVCATFGIATSALLFSLSVDPPSTRAAVDISAQRAPGTPASPPKPAPTAFPGGDSFHDILDDILDDDELKRIDAQSRLTLLFASRARIQREIRKVTIDVLGPSGLTPSAHEVVESSSIPGLSQVGPRQRQEARGQLASLSRNLTAIVLEAQAIRMHLGDLDSRSGSK